MQTFKPYKILYIDHTALLGGGEIALLGLFRSLDLSRFDPTLLLFEDGPLVTRMRATDNILIVPLNDAVSKANRASLGVGSLLNIRPLFEVIRHIFHVRSAILRLNPDLVHTNSLKADIIGGLAARLAGKKVVWHIRDRIEPDYLPPVVVTAFRFLARWIPTFNLAVSEAVLKTLQLPPSKAPKYGVIYDGLEASSLLEGSASIQATPIESQRHLQDPVIALIGRICPWKGQHVFIEAASAVLKRFPRARFRIVGAPLFGEFEYEKGLVEQVNRLGLDDAVTFTGFVQDVPSVIRTATVVVHASTTAEPFGLVIIEGMAHGKPVVATNGGGVPEIVTNGVSGLLVPMNDAAAMAEAISSLLADPVRAGEMGARGRARVEESFTMKRTAREVGALYERLLAD